MNLRDFGQKLVVWAFLPVAFAVGTMAGDKKQDAPVEPAPFVKYAVVTNILGDKPAPSPSRLVVDTPDGRHLFVIPEAYKDYWKDIPEGATRPLPRTWKLWRKDICFGHQYHGCTGVVLRASSAEVERIETTMALSGSWLFYKYRSLNAEDDSPWLERRADPKVYYSETE